MLVLENLYHGIKCILRFNESNILGYREWALSFAEIKHHSKIKKYKICMSDEELLLNDLNDYDLLITLGW